MTALDVAVGGLMVGMVIALLLAPLILTWEAPGDAPDDADFFNGLFVSARERRLWGWTAVALLAIYSTVGVVPEIAATLRELGLASLGTTVAPIAVTLIVFLTLRRWRPGRAELGAAVGVAAVYAMTLSRMSFPVRGHLVEYGLVAVLIHEALIERRRGGRSVPAPWLIAVVATALLGVLDESLQSLHPDRVYSREDLFINTVASIGGVAVSLVMRGAKRGFKRWGRPTR